MNTSSRISRRIAAAGALAIGAAAAAQFQEPGAVALDTLADPSISFYGWAIADMADIDGDGVSDAIVGGLGGVEVRSGATRALLHRFEGDADLGFAVADAGDVDGDGVNDVLAGEPSLSQAFVYSGATGDTLLTLTVPNGVNLGTACAGAGDIDGDGHDDVMVSDRVFGAPDSFDGRVFVFSGSDGSVLREYTGPAGSVFGSAAAMTPDIDGDGAPDHFIAAVFAGKAYLYSGATGDLILDVEAQPGAVSYGVFFCDGLRDVDGDGVPDLYVGDFNANPEGLDAGPFPGAAYVYSGADGELIHFFEGGGNLTGLGPGRGAGDVDGDGLEDIIVGAFNASTGVPNGGQVNIYSGCDGEVIRTFTSTVQDEQLGFDCVGLDDLDGDGAIDFFLSAANGNTVYFAAGEPACPADIDGNGFVNFRDLLLVVFSFHGPYNADTDLNCDGVNDRRDLFVVIANFGPC